MKLNIRKSLLAGTALMAIGAIAVSTSTTAHAATATLTGNINWASGATGAVDGDGTTAAAGDTVIMTTHELTVLNDTTSDDGGGNDTFTLGPVTSTTGNLIVTDHASGGGTLAVTIGSFASSSTGDFTVNAIDGEVGSVTATVTGALNTGGALSVVNTEGAAQADLLILNVGGDLTVAGTTTLTGAVGAGASSAINVTGNSDFTGAVTATGGAGAGSDATLTLSGATNTFTGGLTLTDGVAGAASLVLDGTVAQTVTGVIAGDGDITVTNTHASGVTFAGDSTNTGTITVNLAATDQAVTFTGDVASAISLGDNTDTDTKTATFSGTSQTISGAISGGGVADTVALVFSGGDTVTLSGAATSNIDTVAVTGSTTLDSNAAITAAITVGAGSTLDQGAGNIIGAIANSGVIHQTGAGAITGDITGTGTLNIDNDATYTGSVAGTSADIATGQTLTFAGANTYSVGTTTLTGTGALALSAAAQTVSGNIVAAADGDGAITIADGAVNTTVTGNIGTSAAALATLDIAGAGANILLTTGNVYVDAITANDADTFVFEAVGAQAVSGTITGGRIRFGDSTESSDVTLSGVASSIANAVVTANATARLEANFTTDGTFTNTGDTYVGDGVTLSADDFSNAGTIHLEVKDGGTIGTLESADIGNLDDSSGALTIGAVDFNVTGNIDTGTIEIGTSGDATAATYGTITDNSYRYGFALADNGGALDLTITAVAAADIGLTTTNDNVAAVLDTLADSVDAEILAVVDNFNAAPSQAAANEVLEAAASTVDAGAVVAAMNVVNQTGAITNTRLAALRSGDAVATGMSAGNSSTGAQFWGQAFGTKANQDERDGVDGYDANTYGFAVGVETEALSDNMAVGVALTYANTDVDSKNATTTNTEVDSTSITLYGDLDLDSRTYVSGQLGYSFNDNDSTRHNVGGVAGLTAKGNYDSNQISARVEAGRAYAMEGDLTLTPSVSLAYMNYDADGYTETGAGGASLIVGSSDLNTFEIGLGVEAAWRLEQADGSVMKPAVHLGVRHDLIGDEFEANNTFSGGGTAFKTQGFDPAQTTINGGVGVTYFSTDNWDLTANYDAEFKSDYSSHAGLLKAAYNF